MWTCNTNDRPEQFIKVLLWQLVPCEDKREMQDIRSLNLGPDPNFEIKLHLREKSKGMTQLCEYVHVCDPDNLLSLQITDSHRASHCPAGQGMFGDLQIHTSCWDVLRSRVSPIQEAALACQHSLLYR